MANIAISGDINPSSYLKITEEDIQVIRTKLSIGIKPEDIIVPGLIRDGSRNLNIDWGIAVNNVLYYLVIKSGKVVLEREDDNVNF